MDVNGLAKMYYRDGVLVMTETLQLYSPSDNNCRALPGTFYRHYDGDGLLHRDAGPAELLVPMAGRLLPYVEVYWRHGKIDRRDGPAVIFRDENLSRRGQWTSFEYARSGAFHNTDGFARGRSRSDQEATACHACEDGEYWVAGKRYPARDAWLVAVDRYLAAHPEEK